MTFLSNKISINVSILSLAFLFLLASCGKDSIENKSGGDGPWICDIKSIVGDNYQYQIGLDSNEDVIAASNDRFIKVSKDGFLTSNVAFSHSEEERNRFRVHDGKVFRFIQRNDFENFDPNTKLSLMVYDSSGELISSHTLDTNGLLYDVEMESNSICGLMVYNPDLNHMTLKKIHINDGLMEEVLLSTTGTNPTNLTITENGDYLCSASSSPSKLHNFDNNLNKKWTKTYGGIAINSVKLIPNRGLFIMGSIATPFMGPNEAFIILLNTDGVVQNRVDIEMDSDRGVNSYHSFQVSDEAICLISSEPESHRNMQLMFYDLDLNPISTIDIPGNRLGSNVILNDNESFTFLYGLKIDENSTELFPESRPRIFKFDRSYTLPTNTIEQ